jgi:hypothetical protein
MIVIVLPDIAVEDQLLAKARRKDKEALRQIYQDYFTTSYDCAWMTGSRRMI